MDDEAKKLLLENTKIARKTLEAVQKIEHRLLWQRILGWIKWLLFAVLIVFGVWQIQPYINLILGLYQNLPPEIQNILSQ